MWFSSRFKLLYGVGFILLLASCANVMSPTGGARDDKAPEIRNRTVLDSALNVRGGKMTFEFNEFIKLQDVQNNLIISPFMKAMPKVTAHKKKLTIDIHDSLLEPNTTYHVSLGNAVQDIRESNPYPNLSFTFSTGSYFDSLQMSGVCIDASTGQSDTSVMVMLYDADLPDSAFLKSKPLYAKRASAGNFSFDNLPNRKFSLYALQDLNKNFKYDAGERMAFLDKKVNPEDTGKSIVLYTFVEKNAVDTGKKSKPKKNLSKPIDVKSGSKFTYNVNLDTNAKSKTTFDVSDSVRISFDIPIKSFDEGKIRVFQGQVFDAATHVLIDSTRKQLRVSTEWIKDANYTLKLLKGFALDSNNVEAPAAEFVFKTKKPTDYGYITARVEPNPIMQLQLIKGGVVVATQYATDSLVQFNLLLPDNYQLRVLKDANKNGIWDTGQFIGEKRQPEITEYIPEAITIKANWENRVDLHRKPKLKKDKK